MHSAPPFWRRLAVTAVALILVLLAFAIPVLLRPAVYRAKVTMEVRMEDYSERIFTAQRVSYDPQFVATQCQVLQKSEILRPVVLQLDLAKHYSAQGARVDPEQAVEKLARALHVEEVRNTGLIEMGVYDRDPQMAADIANAIAAQYQNQRIDDLGKALEQFSQVADQQQMCVRMSGVEAARLRAKLKIADPDPERGDHSSPADLALNNRGKSPEDLADYVAVETRYLTDKKILETIEMRLFTARMAERMQTELVKIWERAVKPSAPVSRFSL